MSTTRDPSSCRLRLVYLHIIHIILRFLINYSVLVGIYTDESKFSSKGSRSIFEYGKPYKNEINSHTYYKNKKSYYNKKCQIFHNT